jgi:hypothetical protein
VLQLARQGGGAAQALRPGRHVEGDGWIEFDFARLLRRHVGHGPSRVRLGTANGPHHDEAFEEQLARIKADAFSLAQAPISGGLVEVHGVRETLWKGPERGSDLYLELPLENHYGWAVSSCNSIGTQEIGSCNLLRDCHPLICRDSCLSEPRPSQRRACEPHGGQRSEGGSFGPYPAGGRRGAFVRCSPSQSSDAKPGRVTPSPGGSGFVLCRDGDASGATFGRRERSRPEEQRTKPDPLRWV